MLTLAVVLLLAEPVQPWPQEPTTYRGLPWGSTIDAAKKALGGWDGRCFKLKPPNAPTEACSSHLDVADVRVTDILSFSPEGGLASVLMDFDSKDYGTMRATFIEKYGQPTKIETTNDTAVASNSITTVCSTIRRRDGNGRSR